MHFTWIAALVSLTSGVAQAQAYPTRPIHFVVPFPVDPNDALARLAGQRLSKDLKQPVVVETRLGVTGTMGAEAGCAG